MSRLTDLLRAAKQLDSQLGKDLEDEIQPLQKRLPFGLNFERHAPEAVELAGHKVRKGSKVRILPSRGSTVRGDQRLWRVESVQGGSAQLTLVDSHDPETCAVQVDDLVLVAEFRDWIYPGLRPDGTVERGGDKPFHTVINGENFHVLEQLTFTHEKAIDAIYIDPPYNTGARDWKYNNDYVEDDDLYRHSKWLAFMERRLKLAKRLLNPLDSVLIVTIDEKEYLRLGLLLEQVFPEGRITMVTSSISAGGVSRAGTFARSSEYLFFVQFGSSRPTPLPLDGEWNAVNTKNKEDIYWSRLLRAGTSATRRERPNQFYPIYLHLASDGARFHSVGEPLLSGDPDDSHTPAGCVAVWPIRKDGAHGRWQTSPEGFRELIDAGCARIGTWNGSSTTIYYLKRGERAKVESGIYPVIGHRSDGSVLTDANSYQTTFVPTDIWRLTSHDAGNSGSRLIARLIPGRRFPFPKSLYAVEDALRFFISRKPHAVILDFFAGSGTTAHAVMRLNRQDGGRRQCISVTNNEVAAEEQLILRKNGLRPGDVEWESHGICDHITKPRIRAAITGRTPQGDPVAGDYKFVDEFPMAEGFEENAAFFTLTYESRWFVGNDRAFAAIAPMLWLRAGARGRRIDDLSDGWAVADSYGIIKDLDRATEFVAALQVQGDLRLAFIVTDDEGRYQQIANEIPGIEPVRLYEDYLRNCESNGDF